VTITTQVTAQHSSHEEAAPEQVSSVATRGDPDRCDGETIGDAVNRLPGVAVSISSRNGQMVCLRGDEPRRAPLFIEGPLQTRADRHRKRDGGHRPGSGCEGTIRPVVLKNGISFADGALRSPGLGRHRLRPERVGPAVRPVISRRRVADVIR